MAILNDGRVGRHGDCLCPAGAGDFSVVTTQTREGEGLWEKCSLCGMVINRSGVSPEKMEAFYNRDYVRNNSFTQGTVQSPREHFEGRINSIRPVAEFLKPHLDSSSRVLEIGSGTGELLHLLRDHVGYCLANEKIREYASFTVNELQIEATSNDYLSWSFEEGFDCIVAVNTIDHMYDTLSVIEKVVSDLKPGGLFYVQVPNDLQALKEYLPEPSKSRFQAFMYQKAHYYSFTFDTLRSAVQKSGLRVVEEFSRHEYTFLNYLQWYFLGKPQEDYQEAKEGNSLVGGDSPFARDMNALLQDVDSRFRALMEQHKVGEMICMLARKGS